MSQQLNGKCFALISPAEKLCHRPDEVLDKRQDLGFEINNG